MESYLTLSIAFLRRGWLNSCSSALRLSLSLWSSVEMTLECLGGGLVNSNW